MSHFIDALHCQNKLRPPIWLMRQAGRYMPDYMAYKNGKSLLSLFRDKKAIVDITEMPITHLNMDAKILFSDILIVLDLFSIPYDFVDKIGPRISKVWSLNDFDHFDLKKLDFLFESIDLLVQNKNKPLIGFAGAPFTIASYLIEGGSSREYKKVKQLIYSDPKTFYKLLDMLSDAIIQFLDKQAESGVSALQLFDSWANILSYEDALLYSVGFLRKIVEQRRHKEVPLIFFSKGSAPYLEQIIQTGVSAISIDWQQDLMRVRKLTPSHMAIQGNLDPSIFYGTKEGLKKAVDTILDKMQGHPGFIFNLGHGIMPDAPYEMVKFLVEYIQCQK